MLDDPFSNIPEIPEAPQLPVPGSEDLMAKAIRRADRANLKLINAMREGADPGKIARLGIRFNRAYENLNPQRESQQQGMNDAGVRKGKVECAKTQELSTDMPRQPANRKSKSIR